MLSGGIARSHKPVTGRVAVVVISVIQTYKTVFARGWRDALPVLVNFRWCPISAYVIPSSPLARLLVDEDSLEPKCPPHISYIRAANKDAAACIAEV